MLIARNCELSPADCYSWHAGAQHSHEAVGDMSLTLHDEAGNALAVPAGELYVRVLSDSAAAAKAHCFGSQSTKLPVTSLPGGRLQVKPFKLVSTQEGTAAVAGSAMHTKHFLACIYVCAWVGMHVFVFPAL